MIGAFEIKVVTGMYEVQKKDKPNKKSGVSRLKLFPLFAIAAVMILTGFVLQKSGGTVSLHTILQYTPHNAVMAALFICLFFALKSCTVVIPLSILYIASGLLFSPLIAIFVSTVGLILSLSLPYAVGYHCGDELIRALKEKYSIAEKIDRYQKENSFFTCFFTRIIGCLPGDLLSLYFGACRVSYRTYLLAALAGSYLSLITTTLIGNEIRNPFSLAFLFILVCRIMISAGAIFLKYKMTKGATECVDTEGVCTDIGQRQ